MLSKSKNELNVAISDMTAKVTSAIIGDISKHDPSSFKSYYSKTLQQLGEAGFSTKEQLSISTTVIGHWVKRFEKICWIDPIKYKSIQIIKDDISVVLEYIKDGFDSLLTINDDEVFGSLMDNLHDIFAILDFLLSANMPSLIKGMDKRSQDKLFKLIKRYVYNLLLIIFRVIDLPQERKRAYDDLALLVG